MATPYRHRDRKPMSYDLGRNYKARTTKFGTHVDEHRFIGPINFLEHRSMASSYHYSPTFVCVYGISGLK